MTPPIRIVLHFDDHFNVERMTINDQAVPVDTDRLAYDLVALFEEHELEHLIQITEHHV